MKDPKTRPKKAPKEPKSLKRKTFLSTLRGRMTSRCPISRDQCLVELEAARAHVSSMNALLTSHLLYFNVSGKRRDAASA